MKTILHVLSMNWFSGAESVVITMIRVFHERNLPYRFIYSSPDGPIRNIVEENGIEYAPIEKVSVDEIKRLIKKYHPDVIHAHDRTASLMSAVAAGNIPVISHLHNNAPLMKSVNPKTVLYGLSCAKYKKILGVSKAVFDEFVFGKLIQKKAVVLGNPVDINRIRKLSKEIEITDEFDVISVGRLDIPKNPLLFVDVMYELLKLRPETTIAMVGDGEIRAEVEQRIKELGLEEKIKLLGFQRNPYPYLKKAKVFCITSTWEGFGLAAVEALALGKPVVATPVGGLINIVDERCGAFCNMPQEFASTICSILDDSEKYQRLSSAAESKAEQFNNIDSYIRKIANIYG